MDILIRHAEPGDYEAVHKLYSGPRAVHGTLQLPYPSQELWRKRLAEPPENLHSLVAVADEEVVGQLALFVNNNSPRRSHSGFLGMAVRDDWQGKGVGTALLAAVVDLSDNWLNLLRLELTVFVDNEPGVRLYKRFGFEVEGIHRLYALRDGDFVDAYAMARLHPRSPKAAAAAS
ncbi:MAG: GNAT family N-acetyltransferase [Planctomycetes bacterium]|nr:GNAT family N-acetyltransferase [Planctomycetota bacterium]